MDRLLPLSLLSLLLFGCAAEVDVGAATANVIYGEDDRREFFEVDEEQQRFIRESVVAFIPNELIDDVVPDDVDVAHFTLLDGGICRDHPLANQPKAAGCTGTLIDDELVLTAGHCAEVRGFCEEFSAVFDFYYTAPRTRAQITIDAVYGCAEVLTARNWDGADWAIIRLDRPVDEVRRPAPVAARGVMPEGMEVVSTGFSFGAPAKTTHGVFLENSQTMFNTHLDVSSGASGSGVRDPLGNVVGVLALGPYDEERATCTTDATLTESAEEPPTVVYYASAAVDQICADGYPSARLCDPDFVDPRDVEEPAIADPMVRSDEAADAAPAAPEPLADAAAGGCTAAGASPNSMGWLFALAVLLVRGRRRRAA